MFQVLSTITEDVTERFSIFSEDLSCNGDGSYERANYSESLRLFHRTDTRTQQSLYARIQYEFEDSTDWLGIPVSRMLYMRTNRQVWFQ